MPVHWLIHNWQADPTPMERNLKDFRNQFNEIRFLASSKSEFKNSSVNI